MEASRPGAIQCDAILTLALVPPGLDCIRDGPNGGRCQSFAFISGDPLQQLFDGTFVAD